MRFRSSLFMFLLVAGSFVGPYVAHAQGIPFFGPIIPREFSQCAAGWGMLITVVNRIIALLITLAIVFVAPIMIAWAGFLLVINPVNASGKEQAKKILWNTIIGIVIALAGWLIVDAVMAVLYNPSAVGQTWSQIISSGNEGACLQQAGAPYTPGAITGPGVGVIPTVAVNEQAVRDQLAAAGVTINHPACSIGSNGQGCTNVGGMRSDTVAQIIAIKNACGDSCSVTVTGGTEPGHAAGTYSHGNGYKVDLRLDAGLNAYLQGMVSVGTRTGDHPGPAWTDRCGQSLDAAQQNQYVQESDHWDIRILSACVPPQ